MQIAGNNVLTHDWFPRPLPGNIRLGDRSWCYSSFSCLHYQSLRRHGVFVGHDTGIYNGTFFELGPDAQVVIGNYCTLVGAIICTNGRVEIESFSFLAHEVVVADSFAAVPPTRGRSEAGKFPASTVRPSTATGESTVVSIGENAWIGARAVLLSGAAIGEGAIVGAAAVVDFVVPPFAIVAGNPAKIVGWATKGNVNVASR